jgi:hypothetical protein
MARQPFTAEYTTFVKGLITEASPLTFPENASLEEVNFVLNPDGSRQRRFGIDYEDGYEFIDSGVNLEETPHAVASLNWENVANTGSLDFLVVQVGNKLYFFDGNASPVTGSPRNQGNYVEIQGDPTQPIQGDAIYGRFVVAHGTEEVFILSYDQGTDTVSVVTSRLKIRDLFGVADGLKVDERPATLSVEHKYNLKNQGWPDTMRVANAGLTAAAVEDPIEATKNRVSFYPSNADIVWAAKIASAKEAVAMNSYAPEELEKTVFGSTRAPMGRFILDVFKRGESRETESGIAGLPDDLSSGGVVSVVSYAGRVFYAVTERSRTGVDANSPNIGTMVFYSRVKDSIPAMTECYSEADPSAEHVFDVVATDGGFVTIPEAGQILKLETMGSSLYVFAQNGVWEIHGGEEAFSATNQQLSKTSDIGVASPRSVVFTEGAIAYWSLSGIYLVTQNDLTLRGSATDLTYATIQDLYDNIGMDSKENCVGTYDPFSRTIRWLFRGDVLPSRTWYSKELIYDMNLQAFYLYETRVPDYSFPFVCGYINMRDVLFANELSEVLVDADDVRVETDNVVTNVRVPYEANRGSVKYLTIVRTGTTHSITASHYRNLQYRDWYTFNGEGVDAEARMLTGYITGGSSMINKSLVYLHVYSRRTEQGFEEDGTGGLSIVDPSSCTVQAQWDWVNSSEQGRWSREFEAYRLPRTYFPKNSADPFDYGFTTVVTKNRVRGRGRALSLLFKTKPYHNLHLYGWSVKGTAGEE